MTKQLGNEFRKKWAIGKIKFVNSDRKIGNLSRRELYYQGNY